MRIWPNFEVDGIEYNLEHLTGKEFTYIRAATDTNPARNIRFYIEYSNHCFTEHYGEHEYPHGASHEIRYFCQVRYEHSKNIFSLIRDIISNNIFMQMTFSEHREQFYYLEEHFHGVDYRIFLEISKSHHQNSDVRLKVVSAYEPRAHSQAVGGTGWFRFFSIVDARLNGSKLQRKRRR